MLYATGLMAWHQPLPPRRPRHSRLQREASALPFARTLPTTPPSLPRIVASTPSCIIHVPTTRMGILVFHFVFLFEWKNPTHVMCLNVGSRSKTNSPFHAAARSLAAMATIVSAPSAADRSSSFFSSENSGIEEASPGVAAQPGCMLLNTTPDSGPPYFSAKRSVISTCARLAREYARRPSYGALSGLSTSSLDHFTRYIPADDTLITRAGLCGAACSACRPTLGEEQKRYHLGK